jgi:hypothetical protein
MSEDGREHREDEKSEDEKKERVYDLADPRPEPGVTAPLDEVTEEEAKSGPAGVKAGAGPDPDEEGSSGDRTDGGKEQQR